MEQQQKKPQTLRGLHNSQTSNFAVPNISIPATAERGITKRNEEDSLGSGGATGRTLWNWTVLKRVNGFTFSVLEEGNVRIKPFMLYPCWLPTQEALLVLLWEEREGAGKSQKGEAVTFLTKCPVLWMKCVKHFVKSHHDENIKNRKGLLKNTEHFCLIFEVQSSGGKCFATIHYKFAVINIDANAPHSTGPTTDCRQRSLL